MARNGTDLGGKKARKLRQRLGELESENARLKNSSEPNAKLIAEFKGTIATRDADIKKLQAELNEAQNTIVSIERLRKEEQENIQKKLDAAKKILQEEKEIHEKEKDSLLEDTIGSEKKIADLEEKCRKNKNEIADLKLLLDKAQEIIKLDEKFKTELIFQVRRAADELSSTWWWSARGIANDLIEWLHRHLINLEKEQMPYQAKK